MNKYTGLVIMLLVIVLFFIPMCMFYVAGGWVSVALFLGIDVYRILVGYVLESIKVDDK